MAILEITKDNFDKEVLEAKTPVLLDFWAPWCGPCRMVGPVLEDIEAERKEALLIGKINVDQQPELASRFSVMSIPTLLVFENGKMKTSAVGAMPKSSILSLVDEK